MLKMARIKFDGGAVTAPVPPIMVTVGEGEEANVLTIGWTGILATVPPKTYISVRPSRHSYELLKRYGEFVINLATSKMARTVDYVGIYTGAKVKKLEKCKLTLTKSEHVGAPTIKECPVSIECRVTDIIPMGSHDVFIADVLGFTCDESIVTKDGKIEFDKADLLAYAHGEYFALGEKVGKFGFSTKPEREQKPKTKPAARPKADTHTEAKSAPKTGAGAKAEPRTEKEGVAKRKPFYEDLLKKKKRR